MVTPEASNPLLEHDYCSRPIQSPPQSSPKIAPPSTAATKCIRKMKSVLKPRTPAKVEIPHVESLYCKLPDYYTSVVPQTDKLDNVSENVTSEKKTYNETCPKSSKAQEYYDKLPQYLTSFVNTVIYSLPKSGDSDTDKGKSRKKDLTKNVSKLKEDASQCKVTKNHSNNVQRIETNKVTSSRNKCCNSPRSRSRKTPLQESSNINWHRKTGFKSNSRNKR